MAAAVRLLSTWLLLLGFINADDVPPYYPPVVDLSVYSASYMFTKGFLTSAELTQVYIDRIGEVNHLVHAVSEINPDALQIARGLDLERSQGKVRSMLHGIPILIKDNIATGDEMNNTAGSVCMLGAKVKGDSTVVKLLRDAGAVILGKTSMSEWANGRSAGEGSAENGWSAYGGQVYGAFVKDQDPSGSSSGSAVAASLGLALATIGTETDGSICSPAEFNSIVGVKPTVGLTSRFGVIPLTARQDTVGPITRNVYDAAWILSAMVGTDTNDNYTLAQPFTKIPDYIGAISHSCGAISSARIGIPTNGLIGDIYEDIFGPSGPQKTAAFYDALPVFDQLGATLVHDANFSFGGAESSMQYFDWFSGNGTIFQTLDMYDTIQRYLDQLDIKPPNISDIADIRECLRSNKEEDYPEINTGAFDKALEAHQQGRSSSDIDVWEAYQHAVALGTEDTITGALDKYDLDALILPTYSAFFYAAPGGLPVVTIPLGFLGPDAPFQRSKKGDTVISAPGLPFGLAFLGRKWSEEKLLAYAFAFEKQMKATDRFRQAEPLIMPKTELKEAVDRMRSNRGQAPGLKVQEL
ncbi:hypothetical protein MMC25_006203 [Agyrium rufum]|nr:hypothetical protein [Agyrium rufum]